MTDIENPVSGDSSLPRLSSDNDGSVFMSWVEQKADTAHLYYSRFADNVWSEPRLIESSNEWFVNWADFPSVISRNGEIMASHWLAKKPGGVYSYDVQVATFKEGDLQTSFVVHDDNTPTEHGFVSMVPVTDSSFYATWLDGRNTASSHSDHDAGPGNISNAMTLRGALIHTDGTLLEEAEIDASVCDCCNTSLTRSGNDLIAAYRDRTADEIRDIHFARYTDGSWKQMGSVHDDSWEIAACPVNGPAVAAAGEYAGIAWFTGAGNEPKVKFASSTDSGESFNDPVLIDGKVPLGRVDLVSKSDGTYWLSWLTRSESGASIKILNLDTDGKQLNQFEIDGIDPARGTGFPQITEYNSGVIVAWTAHSGSSKTIRTAVIQ